MNRKIGVFFSFIMVGAEIVSAIFLTPFIVRQFGQSEYGVYTLILSITSYLVLLDLGVGNSVVKFVASYRVNSQENELAKFEGIINAFYALIGIVTIIVGMGIVHVFPNSFSKGLSESEIQLAQKLLTLTTINAAMTLGTSGFLYSIIGYEKFIISKGVPAILTIIRIIASFFTLSVGGRSIEITVLNLIITTISRAVMIIYVFAGLKIPFSFKGWEKQQIKTILSFSGFVFFQMVATQINSMIDGILIGVIVFEASSILAIYGVASTLKSYLATFGGAINGVLMPGVIKIVEKGATSKQIEDEMVRIGRIVFILSGAIFFGFCAFGKNFIMLWVGNEYSNAFYVALFLMSVYVVTLTESIGNQFLWAKNEHKEISIIKFAVVIINVGLTILLIFWDPLYGAVIGTFISILLGDIVLSQIVFKRKLGINIVNYWRCLLKGIFPSLLISFCCSLVLKMFELEGWVGLIVNISFFLLVYVGCLLAFGLNKQEKTFFKRILHI